MCSRERSKVSDVGPTFKEILDSTRAVVQAVGSDEIGVEFEQLKEESPFEAVEKAVLGHSDQALIPTYKALVQDIRDRWNADELFKECTATPSDAQSSWTLEKRVAAAQDNVQGEGGSDQVVWKILVANRDNEQEFHVLPSTTLEALRRKIFCIHDYSSAACGRYQNYCFYFEGKFFVERGVAQEEGEGYVDLTKPIADWADRVSRGKITYEHYDIAGVTFGDIAGCLRVGAPYLFLHQGGCEHILEVVSVSLFHKNDPVDKELYPMLVYATKPRRSRCMLCGKLWARFLCHNEPLTGEDPSKYCAPCFRMAFYDQNDNLLSRFRDMRVYPYYFEEVAAENGR